MQKFCPGFTLLEMLIALTVVAILALSSTAMTGAVARARSDAAMKTLVRAVQTARSEAINSGRRVTLCGSVNDSDCGAEWEGAKIMVFADANNNRRRDDEELLLYSRALPAGRVRWNGSGRDVMRYRPDGSVVEFGSYVYCPLDSDPRYARQLTINAAGRPYFSRDRDGDGVHENNVGRQALSCAPPAG